MPRACRVFVAVLLAGAYLATTACWWSREPLATEKQLVKPVPPSYHRVLLLPDAGPPVDEDGACPYQNDALVLLEVEEDGRLTMYSLDIWTGEREVSDVYYLAEFGGARYLLNRTSVVRDEDEDLFRVEETWRVVERDGRPATVHLMDTDYLYDYLVQYYEAAVDDKEFLKKLEKDPDEEDKKSLPLIKAAIKHKLDIEDGGREVWVRAATKDMQAFMTEMHATIFREGHACAPMNRERLDAWRRRCLAGRLSRLQQDLGGDEIGIEIHEMMEVLAGHAERLPEIIPGLAALRRNPRYAALVNGMLLLDLLERSQVIEEVGDKLHRECFGHRRLLGTTVTHWDVDRADRTEIIFTLELVDALNPRDVVNVRYRFAIDAGGGIDLPRCLEKDEQLREQMPADWAADKYESPELMQALREILAAPLRKA